MTDIKSKLSEQHINTLSTQAIYNLLNLEPDPEVIEDSHQYAQGFITMTEIRAKIMARIQANNI